MRVLPILLIVSFLIFLSAGNVQAKAVWANERKLSVSNSPVTRVKFGNSHIIPGPTYHLMFSDPAKIDARAKNLIHSIHVKDSHVAAGLDGAERPVHSQSKFTGGSRPNGVAPTGTTTAGLESSPSRSSRFGSRRSNGGTSINPRSSGGSGGTVSSPRFGGSSGRVV